MTAETLAIQALLRCWVRETGVTVPPAGEQLRLDAAGSVLTMPVEYQSATGWHRFGSPTLANSLPANSTVLAALLTTDATAVPEAVADLVERVVDSTRRLRRYLEVRAATPDNPATPPFLAAEQALIGGHPLHPTPKSRTGLADADELGAAPELRGSAPLHWFAVDSVLVREGSVGDTAADRLAALAPMPAPDGMVLVPAHPWQARTLLTRPDVQALVAAGRLRDLGQDGPEWSATSSVRTLYRLGEPLMLKLSLGVRITNSARVHLIPELIRGAEMYALVKAGLGDAIAAEYPRFGILGDPAWLAVPLPGDDPSGPVALAVSCRDNPFGADDRVACVAGLVAERPDRADGKSMLATLIEGLADSTEAPVEEVAMEWLWRYVDEVIAPVLWLHGACGLGLEAHQQNTLVTLDSAGWPAGGWYRDNQGYYLSPSRAAGLHALLPGLGAESEAENPDDVIDERLAYYVGVNNLLGLVGALGAAGLADEAALLRAARAALRPLTVHGLAKTLLEAETLPCKANLLTRVAGLDELVGPVETQSVYVRIPNPLRKEPS